MKKLLLLVLIYSTSTAQRTLPNPVILVHGFGASKDTWSVFTDYLKVRVGLSIETNSLTYNLNCDNNSAKSLLSTDVCDLTATIGNKDVYVIDFEVANANALYKYSNQAGAVKQGYALKLAIAKVLAATGADRVTLLGHSMGGLAIREYLQNKQNYQSDGKHHVAKVATIGTPHGGSDTGTLGLNLGSIFSGHDEMSEAVRDLRTNTITNKQGVYLFGGYENETYFGNNTFYNYDINSNGVTGDYIVGLNQKEFPTDIDVSCVVGGVDSDLIVKSKSQNINNYLSIGAEIFNYTCSLTGTCHTEEPKKAMIEMIHAIDEPKKGLIELKTGFIQTGILGNQSQGFAFDSDEYTIFANQKGNHTLTIWALASAKVFLTIKDTDGKIIAKEYVGTKTVFKFDAPKTGEYRVLIGGDTNNGWNTYNLSLESCSLPTEPLSIQASAKTTFCEGQDVNLTSTAGYDEYIWFNGSTKYAGNTRTVNVFDSGNFMVYGKKCGITEASNNTIKTTASKIPPKPTINLETTGFVSSSTTNNQWFKDGIPLKDSTNQKLIASGSGVFMVRVGSDGCFIDSEQFILTSTDTTPEILAIKLYPNPNNGVFFIETPEQSTFIDLQIFDLNGKVVSSQISNESSGRKKIEVGPNCNCILKLSDNNNIQKQIRFISEK